jgi:hypothetical protein
MDVATVTTSDRSLLHAVRGALADAHEAFLCVAFVQEKGIHLLEKELDEMRQRGAQARLLVTTTFATTTGPALGMARRPGCPPRRRTPRARRSSPRFSPPSVRSGGATRSS